MSEQRVAEGGEYCTGCGYEFCRGEELFVQPMDDVEYDEVDALTGEDSCLVCLHCFLALPVS